MATGRPPREPRGVPDPIWVDGLCLRAIEHRPPLRQPGIEDHALGERGLAPLAGSLAQTTADANAPSGLGMTPMPLRPDVSVLMPMLNPGPYLAEAVSSVLTQASCSLELLVIDDGCTDGSREWIANLQDPRVRLIDGPRRGISACLNVALEHARGRWFARCDADDRYPPGRLQRQLEWLQDHPDALAVCSPFLMIDPGGRTLTDPWAGRALDACENIAPALLAGDLSTTLCAFMIKRECQTSIIGFRSYFETAEDIDFTLRLAQEGPIGFLPGCAYEYRLHETSITHRQPSPRRIFFEQTARAFASERSSGAADALSRGSPPAPPADTVLQLPHGAARHRSELLVGESWRLWMAGQPEAARQAAWRAVANCPTHLDAWKAAVLMALRKR